MRQIKFRAWCESNKEMYYPDGIYEFWIDNNSIGFYPRYDKDELHHFNTNPSESEKEILAMQFTGLHDKNGKEIYEGDIVKFHYFYMSYGENMGAQESEHELIGVVEWQNYGYGLSAIKGEHWKGYTGYSDGEGSSDFLHLVIMSESSVHEESFEVIGNIYEHPDLLK